MLARSDGTSLAFIFITTLEPFRAILAFSLFGMVERSGDIAAHTELAIRRDFAETTISAVHFFEFDIISA